MNLDYFDTYSRHWLALLFGMLGFRHSVLTGILRSHLLTTSPFPQIGTNFYRQSHRETFHTFNRHSLCDGIRHIERRAERHIFIRINEIFSFRRRNRGHNFQIRRQRANVIVHIEVVHFSSKGILKFIPNRLNSQNNICSRWN